MKFLSAKKCIYLLLFEALLSIITTVIVTLFAYGTDSSVLQKNIYYQTVSLLITFFIYFNISKINKELKFASYLIIIKAFIGTFINVILPMSTPIIIFNFSLGDALEFILLLLNIPFALYFYNGFSTLVLQKTKNKFLVDKWKKLVTPNIILGVLSLILYMIKLYGDPILFPQFPEIQLALSFCLMVFTLYLEYLNIIYLFKTAKAL